MRISDWRSDVCSSDLQVRREPTRLEHVSLTGGFAKAGGVTLTIAPELGARQLELVSDNAGGVLHFIGLTKDRQRVVEGKSVSVRVDLGGRRIIKKTKT